MPYKRKPIIPETFIIQQFLNNIETWDCILGKGMDNQMFDLIKHSSIYCKRDCEVMGNPLYWKPL